MTKTGKHCGKGEIACFQKVVCCRGVRKHLYEGKGQTVFQLYHGSQFTLLMEENDACIDFLQTPESMLAEPGFKLITTGLTTCVTPDCHTIAQLTI